LVKENNIGLDHIEIEALIIKSSPQIYVAYYLYKRLRSLVVG